MYCIIRMKMFIIKFNTIFTICFYRLGSERFFSSITADREILSLTSLEVITDALLEIMEVCFFKNN